MLTITEIFKSIQGESSHAGTPCGFVRLTGCNLRCIWCDTTYSFYGGTKMSIGEILEKLRPMGVGLVEITGGEPLLQKETPELCQKLLDQGYTVLMETSGSRDISGLPEGVLRILDLKCPHSGHEEDNLWENLDHLQDGDEVKFVISSRRDYEWSCEQLGRSQLKGRVTWFMPADPLLQPGALADWVLKDNLSVRVGLQLHKAIWPGKMQGF